VPRLRYRGALVSRWRETRHQQPPTTCSLMATLLNRRWHSDCLVHSDALNRRLGPSIAVSARGPPRTPALFCSSCSQYLPTFFINQRALPESPRSSATYRQHKQSWTRGTRRVMHDKTRRRVLPRTKSRTGRRPPLDALLAMLELLIGRKFSILFRASNVGAAHARLLEPLRVCQSRQLPVL
jgi:hypothetical protein